MGVCRIIHEWCPPCPGFHAQFTALPLPLEKGEEPDLDNASKKTRFSANVANEEVSLLLHSSQLLGSSNSTSLEAPPCWLMPGFKTKCSFHFFSSDNYFFPPQDPA
jgi:hypothetical protein